MFRFRWRLPGADFPCYDKLTSCHFKERLRAVNELSKTLICFGTVLAGIGIVIGFAGKIPFLGKLPGDILIRKEHFTFYFPLATSILLSVILTVLFSLFRHR